MGWFNFAQGGGGSAASGDVVGPASSVDNNIVTFDGITGKLIQDSGVAIASLITGSTGATDNAIIIADGTGGSTVAASAATLTAAGSLTIPSAELLAWSTDVGLKRHAAGVIAVTQVSVDDPGRLYVRKGSSVTPGISFVNNSFMPVGTIWSDDGSRLRFGGAQTALSNDLWLSSGGAVFWSSAASHAAIPTSDTGVVRDSAAVVRVTDGSTGLGNVYAGAGLFGNANGATANVRSATTTVNLSGATSTASALFPAACIRLGVTARVTTIVTSGDGGTDMNVGDGTDADRYGATIAFAAGTTVDMSNATADPSSGGWVGATGDVVFTCNGGTFSGGVVRVCAHYLDLTAPTS